MNRPPAPDAPAPGGDPWAAFGYLVAGVLFYGALGWGLSVWLHAEYWIPIGILVGAGFGMYMVFARYRVRAPDTEDVSTSTAPTDEAAQETRPDSDDRGETA
jgi:endonuclease/exonuclease/phosphatase (EEP) superfamily protein YafD